MADPIKLRDYLPEMFQYTDINTNSPPVLTQAQLTQLETAKTTGNPATIWKTLSGFGDTYAKAADGIISNPTSFHGEVVTSSWIQTGAPLTKFDKVASDYAVSYANQVINRGGILPSTGQIVDDGQRIPGIEQLYRKALEDNGVPVNAAIDSTMWQSVWGTNLGIEQDRIAGETAYPSSGVGEYVGKLLQFGSAGVQAEFDTFENYTKNPSDGHWYAVAPAPDLGQFAWEGRAPAGFEARINTMVEASKAAVQAAAVIAPLPESAPTIGPADPTRAPSSNFVSAIDDNIVSLKQGGTLSDIVAIENKNGNPITVEDLRLVNGLTPDMDTKLRVGQQLIVPTKADGQLSAMLGGSEMSVDPVNGTTELKFNDQEGALYGSDGRQTDTIAYNSDSRTLSSIDLTSVRTQWADGTITREWRGADPYQSTSANGGELRFYEDGRVSFVSTDHGEAFVDTSATGFDWSNVPGYTETWGAMQTSAVGLGESWGVAVGDGLGGAYFYADGERWNGEVLTDADGAVVGYRLPDEMLAVWADLPSGTALTADAADLIEAAGIDLDDDLRAEIETVTIAAQETAPPETVTVDTSSYAAWTQSRAAEIGAYRNDPVALALVSDPSALALYGSAQAVGAVHAALVNPTTATREKWSQSRFIHSLHEKLVMCDVA